MQTSEKAKQQLLSTLLQVLSLTPIELDLVVSVPPHPQRAPHLRLLRSPSGQPSTREARDHLRLLCGIHREHMIAHNQSRLRFRFMLIQNHEAPVPFLPVPSAHVLARLLGTWRAATPSSH